ncbi:hypothetical protein Franean1_3550 [Parafrankia sp. EAN1pec]|nr:hypothetical protein Franean1_3550 [Frankia sp. EAN1pec]
MAIGRQEDPTTFTQDHKGSTTSPTNITERTSSHTLGLLRLQGHHRAARPGALSGRRRRLVFRGDPAMPGRTPPPAGAAGPAPRLGGPRRRPERTPAPAGQPP